MVETLQSGEAASPRGREAPRDGGSPLPCLNSDNSSKNGESESFETLGTRDGLDDYVRTFAEFLTPYHSKAIFALQENLLGHIEDVGLNFTAFITLTFKAKLFDYRDATKAFNSFVSSSRFKSLWGRWWRVAEQHKDSSWHFHMLVECREDIRTGFSWEAVEAAKRRRSRNLLRACPRGHPLRSVWSTSQLMIKDSKLIGRVEVFPIRSNAEGCGKYLSKYLSKGFIQNGLNREGGKVPRRRLTGKGGNAIRKASARFAWNSLGGAQFRAKLARIAAEFGISDIGGFADLWGPRWAFKLKGHIRALPNIEKGGGRLIDLNFAIGFLRHDHSAKYLDELLAKADGETLAYDESQPVERFGLNHVIAFARDLGTLVERRIFEDLRYMANRYQLRRAMDRSDYENSPF